MEKSRGAATFFSSDLIYDVLRAHESDYILFTGDAEDAAVGLSISRASACSPSPHQRTHRAQAAFPHFASRQAGSRA
ncbi:MAG: hypothetical protein U1E87_00385 [Alphaproteobacteria bacterium]